MKKIFVTTILVVLIITVFSQEKGKVGFTSFKYPAGYTFDFMENNTEFYLEGEDASAEAVVVVASQSIDAREALVKYYVPNKSKEEAIKNGLLTYYKQSGVDEKGESVVKYVYKNENVHVIVIRYIARISDEDFNIFFESFRINVPKTTWIWFKTQEIKGKRPQYLEFTEENASEKSVTLTCTDYGVDNINIYITIEEEYNEALKETEERYTTKHLKYWVTDTYTYYAEKGNKAYTVKFSTNHWQNCPVNDAFMRKFIDGLQPTKK